jgi:acetyl esterase/lipase/lysophospholipase L1-like esterase
MIHRLRDALLIVALMPAGLTVAADERHPMWKYPPDLPGATVHTFKTVGQTELKAWVFRPDGLKPNERRPAVVFFFGGGWNGGTPGQFYQQCRYLASRGIVAISADYRVRRRHKVLAPVCLADAKSAIRWVRSNGAQLGVDPNRIVAAGGSAGGHLAACTGIIAGFDDPADDLSISAVPNAMALYNPAVLLAAIDGKQQIDAKKLEDLAERTDGKASELSPLLHVRRGLPPTIIFHGTNDEAVPYWTVTRFAREMTAAGNRCELKAYTGAPHGFFNTGRGGSAERQDVERQRYAATTLQLDTFLQSLGYLKGPATITAAPQPNIHLRGSYTNSRIQFEREHTGHVAFIGGSITEMNGYRPMMVDWLQKRFPKTKFNFTDAGIASTCSTTGAFRLGADVLSAGPVDLFFIEFAVNDDQDAGHAGRECVRGMEGIIRQVRRHNPHADIVITHFVNPGMLKIIQAGKLSVSQSRHEDVARHYSISTINVGQEIADRIAGKTMTWSQYGGTHPKQPGNAMVAQLNQELLTAAWSLPLSDSTGQQSHASPEQPLDPLSYADGRFVGIRSAKIGSDWKIHRPEWKKLRGSSRSRFVQLDLLEATESGAELSLKFKGTAVGAYVLAGPDAGTLEFSIDGENFQPVDLFHRHSRGLHYPRTVMFRSDLDGGDHALRLRLSADHNKASSGTAARILQFVAN